MLTLFDYHFMVWLFVTTQKRKFFFRKLSVKIMLSLFFPLAVDRTFFFHELSARRALITAFDINCATGKSCSVPPFINLLNVLGISVETALYSKFFWMSFWFGNLKNSIHCKYCPCLFSILHSLIQVCLELAHN